MRKLVPSLYAGPEPLDITFDFDRLKAYTDHRFELELGRRGLSLTVSVTFPRPLSGLSEVRIYASSEEKPKVVSYTWQEVVSMENQGVDLLSWSGRQGRFYFALFPHCDIPPGAKVKCRIGAPVALSADLTQPWRIARLRSYDPVDIIALEAWFNSNRVAIMTGTKTLDDEERRTPLQHAAEAVGDPKGVTMLFPYRRYVDTNARTSSTGRNALMTLVAQKPLGDPRSELYPVGLALLRAFLTWEWDLSSVDNDGNTALHLAAIHHNQNSDVFSTLLRAGANSGLQNNAGRTPFEEASHRSHTKLSLDLDDLATCLNSTQTDYASILKVQKRSQMCPVPTVVEREIPSVVDTRGRDLQNAIRDDSLRAAFDACDVHGRGWLTENQFRQFYTGLEKYGVMESREEVDRAVYGSGVLSDGRISYDEFAILLLRLNAL